jgi:radical SAM/Cys-rich protein
LEENVAAQRGEEVYGKSVEAIRVLNSLGYGTDPDLELNLVYNPVGAFLPGDPSDLEKAYRRELHERFGISFTNLLTITNMPLGRFKEQLKREGGLEKYVSLLSDSFNVATVNGLMCRHQIHVGWDGTLYDCDFNLAMDLVMNHGAPDHIDKWKLDDVVHRRIVTGAHCFGCTAGRGSSCSGALTDSPS